MKYEIAVIVAVYNPVMDKLYRTLRSIVMQENVNYQIIIADDATLEDYSNQLDLFFDKYKFTDYQVYKHKRNVGTVKNVFDAIRRANADYIKLISPGDYFYHSSSLSKWLEFIKLKGSNLCFGKIVPYYEDDKGGLHIVKEFRKPNNDLVYKKYDSYRATLINMCLISNTPVGAAYIGKTEIYIKYFSLFIDKVKYLEDFAYRLMVLDGVKIDYYESYSIWYEVGTGVSTAKSDKWKVLLRHDENAVYRLMSTRSNEKNKNHFAKLLKYKDKKIFRFMKVLYYPEYIFWVVQKKRRIDCYRNSIDNDFFDSIK